MAFNREAAVRLIVGAVRPHLTPSEYPVPDEEKMVKEVLKALHEEPWAANAFEAMCKVIWDQARTP